MSRGGKEASFLLQKADNGNKEKFCYPSRCENGVVRNTTCRVTKARPRDPAHDSSTDTLESWPVWPLAQFALA